MKMKCDFVTNSSSCSFVMIGVKTTYKELKKKYGEDLEDSIPTGLTVFTEPDVIGKIIVEGASDDIGIASSQTDLKKLEKTFNEVAEALGIEVSKVKLITGERNC